jgi:hypothetical protein
LPPSPYQQTYNPQTGLTFAPASGAAPPAAPPQPRKGPPKVAVAVFVIVFLVAILVFSGALDFLTNPSGSSSPSVQVTNTSASHRCPTGGVPTETFLFTLVNSDSTNANAAIGFYLNDAQITSGTYSAPAGSSTPYSVTANLASCPPSGSTYYLSLISVTAA